LAFQNLLQHLCFLWGRKVRQDLLRLVVRLGLLVRLDLWVQMNLLGLLVR
jgi:hypothetical protein